MKSKRILNPKLEDCKARNKQYPKTFLLPSLRQLNALKVGDFAKVIAPGERFWVIIRSRKGNDFVGEIDSILIGDLHKLKHGDLIAFKRDNICAING